MFTALLFRSLCHEIKRRATVLPSAMVRKVQVQQLRERFVLADVSIPPVGGGYGRIERGMDVGQPLRRSL